MRIGGLKLTFASRILAGYLIVFGIASWVFYDALIEEIKPVVRQSAESVLIDTANIFAELVAKPVAEGDLNYLQGVSDLLKQRELNAIVWQHLRTSVILNFYITDAQGVVIFSSEGKDVGVDYSQWRDVYLTLNGQYGARSTVTNQYNADSTVMFVAAPIMFNEKLLGVLTVYNPNQTMQPFIESSRKKVLIKWLLVLFASGLVALLLSFWLSRSVSRLAHYAKKVQSGERASLPHLLGSELNELAQSIEQMRIKLEGKHYVEHYVQSLTHELKSPMAAIRGAAEMLQEDLPTDVKIKFLSNINDQNNRMQRAIDQLLRLSILENQSDVISTQKIQARKLCEIVIEHYQSKALLRDVDVQLSMGCDFLIQGDEDMLVLALGNILDNAIEFSSRQSIVFVNVSHPCVCIEDEGEGIPEYALEKVGMRFYSLPRPNGDPKSTGLGLALTREICRMHGATLNISNRDGTNGASVSMNFNL